MTQKSWPWSTVTALGDGATTLSEAVSREFLAVFFGVQNPAVEGVSKGVLNELAVSGAASPLAVATGSGICYGLYINDAVVNPTVTTPAVGTTGGRVVLQTNWAGTGGGALEARTRIATKKSADGVAAIPVLTQAFGTTWEISLATFTITTGGVITLTDDRTFRKSTAMVGTSELAALAVTTAKIALLNITTALINDLAVTSGKLAAGSVIAGKLADGAVDTAARIADGIITTAKLGALQITTALINDLAVTSGKLAAGAVVAGKLADGAVDTTARIADGIITAAKVGALQITTALINDLAVTTGKVAALAITTAKLALNSVDDTIVGDRVPQFYRRQGGNPAQWSSDGVNNYTPGAVRMQAGAAYYTGSGYLAITYPVPFSDFPVVFVQAQLDGDFGRYTFAICDSGMTTGFQLQVIDHAGVLRPNRVFWLAIGPE